MNYPPPPGPQPPHGQPYYPRNYGPPPKKGIPNWGIAVILAAVAIVGIGVATGSINTPKAAPAGNAVHDDGIKFTITTWEQGATETRDGLFSDTAQGEFVIVKFQASNLSDEPQDYTLSQQRLFDEKGREFEPISSGHTSLNPGFTEEESIAFDVPKGTVATAIEFKGGFFGSGARVKLTPTAKSD
ncbi:DUF4352 domain-containing protein [Nocardia sp. NPDC058658]|uniref:DUF4352 domain-containing protein n=1 Tax=Nocardia sp. NPDC058658 TaxID=3346580 RepID=UPI00364AFC22